MYNTYITTDSLTMAGYRPHPNYDNPFAAHLWQRIVRDPQTHEKRYFIDIEISDYPGNRPDLKNRPSVKAHLYRKRGDRVEHMVVDFFIEPYHALVDVEAFYAELYEKLGCCPDVHNNS